MQSGTSVQNPWAKPAGTHSWLHNAAQIRHLAKLAERVSDLEKKLKNINVEG